MVILLVVKSQGQQVHNWGGGGLFIYSCLHLVKTIDFKRINDAEHEYMNIGPLNYLSSAVPKSLMKVTFRFT